MSDTGSDRSVRRPGLLEQDNYEVAHRVAAERLASLDDAALVGLDGVHGAADGRWELPLFGARVRVEHATGVVTGPEGESLPLWEQILVLHYLLGASGSAPRGEEWVAYRELPEASFYAAAFHRQVCQPLAARFGERPERLTALVGRWATTAGELGDASLVFQALPGLRLALVVWAGDEDFPAEGNVLFSRSAAECLSAEDAAVLADLALRRVLDA